MKILRITPSFASKEHPGSGLNAYYHSIYSSNENFILTEFKSASYMEVPSNVNIKPISINKISLGNPRKRNSLKLLHFFKKLFSTIIFLFKSRSEIDKFSPHIVHLYTPIHLITGFYCKIRHNSKLVVSLHGTDVLRIKSSRFYKNLLNLCDSILLLSHKMREDLSLNHKDVTYIGNGYDSNIYNYKESSKRRKNILTVGSLRWQKDQATLIKAFALFLKKHNEYRLIIIGDGELKEELKKLASSEGVDDSIDFFGIIPPKDVASIMNQSDFFILSSISEGSPKVVLEAMSCGLPIVSTSVGDIPLLIRDFGISCPPENPILLSDSMSDCVQMSNNISRKDISKSVSNRSWINITNLLENKYQELLINE